MHVFDILQAIVWATFASQGAHLIIDLVRYAVQ